VAASNSSVVTLRAKGTVATGPLSLGYSSLVEPDTYDPEKPTFKLNAHLINEHSLPGLVKFLQEKVLTEAAIAKLREEMVENWVRGKMKPADAEKKAAQVKVISAEDWLAKKLKDPKEGARFLQPHIVFANKAEFKTKTGEVKQRSVQVWDSKNNLLAIKKLRLGAESIIEVVVFPNLYFSKLDNIIQPSLKLVGVRIVALKQFGRGGAAPAETDEAAIKEVLGEAYEAEDLSAYAAGGGSEEDAPEEDDAAALTPEEQAKGLF